LRRSYGTQQLDVDQFVFWNAAAGDHFWAAEKIALEQFVTHIFSALKLFVSFYFFGD